jgi:hypothetical protein
MEFRKLLKTIVIILFCFAIHSCWNGTIWKPFFKDICEGIFAWQPWICWTIPVGGFLSQQSWFLTCMEVPGLLKVISHRVDDMCDCAGLTACSCIHCRARFSRIMDMRSLLSGTLFWGILHQGFVGSDYESGVQDWIRMKSTVSWSRQ